MDRMLSFTDSFVEIILIHGFVSLIRRDSVTPLW